MVRSCSIKGCTKLNKNMQKKVSHHKFPTDALIRQRWVKNITLLNKQLYVNTNGTVCSAHFEEKCKQSYYEFSNTTLKTGSIPTIFANSNEVESENIEVLYSEDEEYAYSMEYAASSQSPEPVSTTFPITNDENTPPYIASLTNSTPKASRSFRYPGEVDIEVAYTPRTTKNAFKLLKKSLAIKSRCLKLLRQKNYRNLAKIYSMEKLLKDLKTKS